jgi:hypothetical protein
VLEDKLVQRATVAVLNQIYEVEFLGYGFRPGHSQHDVLEALTRAIMTTKVDYVLDATSQPEELRMNSTSYPSTGRRTGVGRITCHVTSTQS